MLRGARVAVDSLVWDAVALFMTSLLLFREKGNAWAPTLCYAMPCYVVH